MAACIGDSSMCRLSARWVGAYDSGDREGRLPLGSVIESDVRLGMPKPKRPEAM